MKPDEPKDDPLITPITLMFLLDHAAVKSVLDALWHLRNLRMS